MIPKEPTKYWKIPDFIVSIKEVVVEITNCPRDLLEMLQVLEELDINIEYIYSFTLHQEDKFIVITGFEQPDQAKQALQTKGIKIVEGIEAFETVATSL